ncbi:MAG: hypothetical protein EON49_22670 [Acidovorax sp.]|nr:MAG: hypothetical protein EON49_22670 [Acidovorax sp.]
MPAQPHDIDVWSVEGQFQHLIYSPKGTIEGVMIDSEGAPAQFVCDAHDSAAHAALAGLKSGQAVVIEGTVAEPSPKGEAEHEVYQLERVVSVDGKPAAPHHHPGHVAGTVARLNYARHGEPNGVVLDTGDFIHTKPDGLKHLGLKVGDKVKAEGDVRPLATGGGQVVQARTVNGKPVGPGHG